MEDKIVEEKISKWIELKDYFIDRLKSPLEHPEYIIYFVLIVIGAGGISIWTGLSERLQTGPQSDIMLIKNIAAFSVAIIASGAIELFFTNRESIRTTLFLISVLLIVVGVSSYFWSNAAIDNNGYFIAVPFSIFSLLIWWISNAENANLTENFFRQQSEESDKLNSSLNQYDE